MDKHIFDSTNLRYGIYDQGTIYIGFTGDKTRIYSYPDQDWTTWKALKEADSSGRFFNKVLRGKEEEEVTNV